MAGVPGFEPGMPIPKTGALPLGYTPTMKADTLGKREMVPDARFELATFRLQIKLCLY